jgi:hypothetical protein
MSPLSFGPADIDVLDRCAGHRTLRTTPRRAAFLLDQGILRPCDACETYHPGEGFDIDDVESALYDMVHPGIG